MDPRRYGYELCARCGIWRPSAELDEGGACKDIAWCSTVCGVGGPAKGLDANGDAEDADDAKR